MARIFLPILFLLCSLGGTAQVVSEAFDEKISSLLNYSVPIMTVEDLEAYEEPILILDAREIEEYEISHIPGAIHFGYAQPQFQKLEQIDKRQPIVLYCSIGYRSEKMGEELLEKGFVNVYNLYGSIFEWANQGKSMIDPENQPTTKIHTYNKNWSQWVDNPAIEKVW